MKQLLFVSILCLALCACGDSPTATHSEPTAETPVVRTNIRMAEYTDDGMVEHTERERDADHIAKAEPMIYQMEGPAWENDRIGFRIYFDERNGTDIFGKKTSAMVLDSVGLNGNYHEMGDWGMDVLKVGTSLGAGGIALMIDDVVHKLGDTPSETFRILEEGPDRSSFVIEYRGWEVDGRSIDLDWNFEILAGEDGFNASVTATGLRGDETLLTGIVNLHSDTLYLANTPGRFVAYTYGPQAELDHLLGMAVSVGEDYYVNHGELPKKDAPVTTTYYVQLKLEEGKPTPYKFLAGWAPGDEQFATREGFAAILR